MNSVKPTTHFSIYVCISVIIGGLLIFFLIEAHNKYSLGPFTLFIIYAFAFSALTGISGRLTSIVASAICDKCGSQMEFSKRLSSLYTCEACNHTMGYTELTQKTDSLILKNSSVQLDRFEDHERIIIGEDKNKLFSTQIVTAGSIIIACVFILNFLQLNTAFDTIRTLLQQQNYILLYIYIPVVAFFMVAVPIFLFRQLRTPKAERYRLYKNHLHYQFGRPTRARARNQFAKPRTAEEESADFLMFFSGEDETFSVEGLREMRNKEIDNEKGIFVNSRENTRFNLARYSTDAEREWLLNYLKQYYQIAPEAGSSQGFG